MKSFSLTKKKQGRFIGDLKLAWPLWGGQPLKCFMSNSGPYVFILIKKFWLKKSVVFSLFFRQQRSLKRYFRDYVAEFMCFVHRKYRCLFKKFIILNNQLFLEGAWVEQFAALLLLHKGLLPFSQVFVKVIVRHAISRVRLILFVVQPLLNLDYFLLELSRIWRLAIFNVPWLLS